MSLARALELLVNQKLTNQNCLNLSLVSGESPETRTEAEAQETTLGTRLGDNFNFWHPGL